MTVATYLVVQSSKQNITTTGFKYHYTGCQKRLIIIFLVVLSEMNKTHKHGLPACTKGDNHCQ